MKVAGLDLSLTRTGFSNWDGEGIFGYPLEKDAPPVVKARRLRAIGIGVSKVCKGADVVLIEAPFNGPHQSWQLGELHGVVKVILLQAGIPFVLIPNGTLKKYATNDGGAGKDKMIAAAVRDGFQGHDNNVADAWFLRRMGLAHYRDRDVVAPKFRQSVVQGFPWPSLEREGAAVGRVERV